MQAATSDDYEIIFQEGQPHNQENALVRILRGKFTHFVYQYGQVSINEKDDGDLKVSYSYELKQAPETYEPVNEAEEKKEFEELAGKILYDIVVNTEKVKERIEANGVNDTGEPDKE